jgi:hypothetical protein
MRRYKLASLLLTVLTITIAACSHQQRDGIQIHQSTDSELSLQMTEMSASLRRIIDLYLISLQNDNLNAEAVITELNRLEQLSLGAHSGIQRKDHSAQLAVFLRDIELAKQTVRQSPTDIAPAARLITSCLECHQSL